VRETLASGCLTTAFVWTQHQGVVRRLRSASAEIQAAWMPDLCAGRTLGGLLPTPEPLLRIRPSHDGFTISGSAPAVSGWGHVSVLLVTALDDGADGDGRAPPRRCSRCARRRCSWRAAAAAASTSATTPSASRARRSSCSRSASGRRSGRRCARG